MFGYPSSSFHNGHHGDIPYFISDIWWRSCRRNRPLVLPENDSSQNDHLLMPNISHNLTTRWLGASLIQSVSSQTWLSENRIQEAVTKRLCDTQLLCKTIFQEKLPFSWHTIACYQLTNSNRQLQKKFQIWIYHLEQQWQQCYHYSE